jgi:hypothetical protein
MQRRNNVQIHQDCRGPLSSASSTVTVRRDTLDDSELLPATATLEPSLLSFPKLQLDASELGSAVFGDGPVGGFEAVAVADAEGLASAVGCGG